MSANAERTAASLIAGDGDVSWGGPLRLMLALEKADGPAAVAFCEVVGRDPFFLLGREPNPKFRLADLVGRKVATVSEVPTPWVCLQQDLRLAGIAPEQIHRITGRSMAENVGALRSGAADVVQVFHPFGGRLVYDGAAHVWYTAASRGLVSYTTLNTRRDFAERHPEVLAGMCRAMYRTLKWVAAHDGAQLAELLRPYFPDIPAPVLAACVDNYKSIGLWNRTPILQREGLEWLRDAALAAGLLKKKFAYEECVDMRYAEAAVRENPPALKG